MLIFFFNEAIFYFPNYNVNFCTYIVQNKMKNLHVKLLFIVTNLSQEPKSAFQNFTRIQSLIKNDAAPQHCFQYSMFKLGRLGI
jgi:hypothetical protein